MTEPRVDETGSDDESPHNVLYPIFGSESETTLAVAAGIARATGRDLLVGRVDVEGEDAYETSRDVAQTVFRAEADDSLAVDVQGRTLTGPSPLEAVVMAAARYDADAIVMGPGLSERLEGRIARRTNCDTVVVNDRTPPESIASILVPVAGGAHSGAAVDVAGTLAAANDAWVELVHVVGPDDSTRETAQSLLETGRARLPVSVTVDTRVVEADDVVDTIESESNCHDLTIIGAPQKGRLRQLIFGSTATDIRDRAQNTVVMVRYDPDGTLFSGALSE